MRQTMINCYLGIERALEMKVNSELSTTYDKIFYDFSNNCNSFSVTEVSINRNKPI